MSRWQWNPLQPPPGRRDLGRFAAAVLMIATVLVAPSPSWAGSTPKLSMSGQIGRNDQEQLYDVDDLSVFEVQSVGCATGGIITSAAAVATGTAATMVTGGAALPLAGEVVASFVTYFTAGCAVGAIVAPGVPLLQRRIDAFANGMWATIADFHLGPDSEAMAISIPKGNNRACAYEPP